MTWLPSFDRIRRQVDSSHGRRLTLIAVASGLATLLVEHLPIWSHASATATAGMQTTMAGGGAANSTGMSGMTGAMPASAMPGTTPAATMPTSAAPHTAAPAGGAGTQAGGTGTQTGGAGAPAGGTGTQTGNNGVMVLATVGQIPVGSAVIFSTHEVVVTRPTAETLNAFSIVCTHAGCLLNRVQARRILCPCHRGIFNLDGSVFSGPPPAPLQAATHVRLQGDQIIISA